MQVVRPTAPPSRDDEERSTPDGLRQVPRVSHPTNERQLSRVPSEFLVFAELALDLGVELRLMLVVIGEGGVDLGHVQRAVMLMADFLGAPAIGDVVERDLNYLIGGARDDRPSLLVELDERRG